MNSIKLRDIITEEFQNEIQNSFALATGFGVVFTDADGNHIGKGGNFCKFCKKINQTEKGTHYCALSNKHAIEIALKTKRPSIYLCHAGLINIEIPLIYNNECIGAITAGQVICSEKNAYPHDEISSEINWLHDTELAGYYGEIQVMSCNQIEATTTALSNITNYIIQTVAYSQMQQELFHQAEELLKIRIRQQQLEEQLKIAKLDALQKQVTPHFIFNVLNSISRLLALQEYDTAAQMLDSFAQMMRYNLANIKSAVMLQQELDYIQNYLTIQKIRFGNRIDYQILCEPKLKSMFIPFFSIQPLIENAIEHGLLCKPKGGKLSLKCIASLDHISICIEDNGVGIPVNKLGTIHRTILQPDTILDPHHVGLYNCYHRLLLMFNDNVSFTINSKKDIGTTIIIEIWGVEF